MKRHEGAAERRKADAERDAREAAPLHARIEQMLTEARVIQPGAQALLGFQLVIVLTGAFERLPRPRACCTGRRCCVWRRPSSC